MRQDHGNIGKSMLKPFVDAYAKKQCITTIGETTIQKIIKRRLEWMMNDRAIRGHVLVTARPNVLIAVSIKKRKRR